MISQSEVLSLSQILHNCTQQSHFILSWPTNLEEKTMNSSIIHSYPQIPECRSEHLVSKSSNSKHESNDHESCLQVLLRQGQRGRESLESGPYLKLQLKVYRKLPREWNNRVASKLGNTWLRTQWLRWREGRHTPISSYVFLKASLFQAMLQEEGRYIREIYTKAS